MFNKRNKQYRTIVKKNRPNNVIIKLMSGYIMFNKAITIAKPKIGKLIKLR